MDFTLLKTKTGQSTSGGGYFGFRVALQEEVEAAPIPDAVNPSITSDDFYFKSGKSWIEFYAENKEYEIEEDPSEQVGSEAYTNTLKAFLPGENDNIRRFINEGHAAKNVYVLIDNCEDSSSYLFGKGSCCPATMTMKFKSGKKPGDQKGWEVVVKVEGSGVITKYTGVGSINKTYSFAANDATPDVSKGTGTYLIPANTVATEITALDNAVQGSIITLKWTSASNASTITDGDTFHLTDDFTPAVGATLTLQAIKTNEFSERGRYLPA